MREEAPNSAMTFVFEGSFDLGAVELDLTVVDNHVLVHDFRYAQLAQMFCGLHSPEDAHAST